MKAQSLRSNNPIPLAVLAGSVPALFAAEKHESRSDRYMFIPTIDILQALQKEGFEVFGAMQAGARKEDVFQKTKHQIRLRHRSMSGVQIGVGEVFNELSIINSHGGQSNFIMDIGTFRLVCSNGSTVSENYRSVSVRHSGNMIDDVIEGAYEVIQDFDRVTAHMQEMKTITLTKPQQRQFAKSALSIKYKPEEVQPNIDDVLKVRRSADNSDDLFTVYNRVQEALIRGGLPKTENFDWTDRKAVVRKTRPVNSIDESKKINQSLWLLTEGMLELRNLGVV